MHTDLFAMAAASLFHIVRGHRFGDGNKQAGAGAALVFLALNGVDVQVSSDALVDTVLAAARGELRKDAVAEFLRRRSRR